jgi:hypothetical protein
MHPTACEAVGYAQQEVLQQRGTLEQQHSHSSDPFQSQAQAWCLGTEGTNAVQQLQPLNDHSPNALPQQGDQAVHYTNVHRWDEDLLQTFDPLYHPTPPWSLLEHTISQNSVIESFEYQRTQIDHLLFL